VHVLYAVQDLALMPGSFGRVAPRRVITVFGSDFTRLSTFRRSMMAPVFGQATSITFANPATMEAFRLHYGFPAEKLSLCRFGLEPLERLMKISTLSVAASLSALGLPAGKTIITVGYNFNSIQQHLPVMQALSNSHELLKRKEALLFVFPLTYGTEKEYLKKLKQALETFPYPFITFESYLSEEDNAHLRRSSDIMLQMQQHDQFSGSMQEYLFAGCLVITGSWLDYRVLSDEGAYFRSVGALSEVGAELNLCLDHLAAEKLKCKANEAVISRLSSWNETMPGWMNLYLG
jgi:hypothetical protein